MAPPLEHHVFICTNERSADDPKGSCVRAGAHDLHQHAKEQCFQRGLRGQVRVNKAGCLDACAHGCAVVVYGRQNGPEGVWYSVKTTDDVDAIIDGHLVGGNVVERLRMRSRP